jgi:hypothetical protein
MKSLDSDPEPDLDPERFGSGRMWIRKDLDPAGAGSGRIWIRKDMDPEGSGSSLT